MPELPNTGWVLDDTPHVYAAPKKPKGKPKPKGRLKPKQQPKRKPKKRA
jgi:hypothetical protein